MKKLILLLLILLTSISIYAQENLAYFTISTNVRSGPSTEYGLRGGILGSGSLTVTGKTNFDSSRICTGIDEQDKDMWLRVDFHGVEGWVQYCLTDYDGDVDNLPIVEPLSTFIPRGLEVARIPDGSFYGMVVTDRLGKAPDSPYIHAKTRLTQFIHLRAMPTTNAEILDYISSQYVYVIDISDDGVWVKVEYDAKLTSCLLVNKYDDCPYERISGWVALYLLSMPKNWQTTFVEQKN